MRRVGTAAAALGTAVLLALLPATGALAAPAPPVELLPPTAVGSAPTAVALSPDGTQAYVLDVFDQLVHVIDTATNTPAAAPVPITTSLTAYLLSPSIVVHPDGRLFILDPGDTVTVPASIVEIDPATWQVFAHELVVPVPWDDAFTISLALTADGGKAYVGDAQNGTVLVVDIPAAAGPGTWSVGVIDVAGSTAPQIVPGSLTVAGNYLYVLDLYGELGGDPTGVAVIGTDNDQLEPGVISYTAPPGTVDGILEFPTIKSSPDGSTILISASAELDDGTGSGSGDYAGFFWTFPGGTIPSSATYLAEGFGEASSFSFSVSGATAYVVDCFCLTEAWTLDVAGGAGTLLDVSAAVDLDDVLSMAASPDGTRLFVSGLDVDGDGWLWQLSTVTDDALAVAGPTNAEQGGSATLTVTGLDNSGNPIDLTPLVEFSSSVATDTFAGNVVTFPHASPHTITASYVPVPGGPAFAVGSITIEVAATLPPTGSADPTPVFAVAALLLVIGTALLAGSARLRAGR